MTELKKYSAEDLELLLELYRRGIEEPEELIPLWKEELRKKRAKRKAEDKLEPNPVSAEKVAKLKQEEDDDGTSGASTPLISRHDSFEAKIKISQIM